MDAVFVIKFTPPDSRKDYHEKLFCITDREKFIVTIRTIGARGIYSTS